MATGIGDLEGALASFCEGTKQIMLSVSVVSFAVAVAFALVAIYSYMRYRKEKKDLWLVVLAACTIVFLACAGYGVLQYLSYSSTECT